MRRYLVVANQTLGGEELWAAIRERMASGDCHFHLLVPATPAGQLDPGFTAAAVEGQGEAAAGPEGLDRRTARQLLEDELDDADPKDSAEDLQKELKITETAAKVRVHRARKKLKETLHPTGEEL